MESVVMTGLADHLAIVIRLQSTRRQWLGSRFAIQEEDVTRRLDCRCVL
jgi:hypothetical protein